MVFIYPPARLITPALVPLAALADTLEILQPGTIGGSGASHRPHITTCASASFHHTTIGKRARDGKSGSLLSFRFFGLDPLKEPALMAPKRQKHLHNACIYYMCIHL